MRFESIPGFSALKFKEEVRTRLQAEQAGLTPEEVRRRRRVSIEHGPLGEWWKQLRAAKRAEVRAALEREELEDAA